MEKKTRSIKKMITILLVLAVLIMALPMTVVAKGNKDKQGGNAYGHSKMKMDQEEEDEDLTEEDEEEGSERSLLVAERNRWAKEKGIPPGHANLLYKYIVATIQPGNPELTSLNLASSFDTYYDAFLATLTDEATGTHSVKAFRDFIKGLVITLSGTEEEAPI